MLKGLGDSNLSYTIIKKIDERKRVDVNSDSLSKYPRDAVGTDYVFHIVLVKN